MLYSPSQFDGSSVKWCSPFLVDHACSVSRMLRFLIVSPMSVAWQLQQLAYCSLSSVLWSVYAPDICKQLSKVVISLYAMHATIVRL